MNKKKILVAADVANWCFDRKAKKIKSLCDEFQIDIGYLWPPDEKSDWTRMEKSQHYDVVWLMDDRYPIEGGLESYVRKNHAKGTRVILSLDYTISWKDAWRKRKVLSLCDVLAINNKQGLRNLKLSGLNCVYTPDSVDLNIFQYHKPIELRDFSVLFVASRLQLEHKGYGIFCEVKERLTGQGIRFTEIIADSHHNEKSLEAMNEIYNECRIYVCLSKSEGGPLPLLEAAACGCVPVSTAVGCARGLLGSQGLITDRTSDAVSGKILRLKNDGDLLAKHSRLVRQKVVRWSWENGIKNHSRFLKAALR